MKRPFLGRLDPDRIVLSDVFGNHGVIFSTPLDEQGRVHKVFVEIAPYLCDFFVEVLYDLTNCPASSRGKWCGIDPVEDSLIVLSYDRQAHVFEKNLQLLSQVLYMDLARVCNLQVIQPAVIEVVAAGVRTCTDFVHLPASVSNGSRTIPTIVSPRIYIS